MSLKSRQILFLEALLLDLMIIDVLSRMGQDWGTCFSQVQDSPGQSQYVRSIYSWFALT